MVWVRYVTLTRFELNKYQFFAQVGPPGINPAAEVIAASPQLPYPVQHQGGMPIPYGATPATPYPAYVPPPMPTTYNPYATMPYPTQGIHKDLTVSSSIIHICDPKGTYEIFRFLGGYNPYQGMPQAPYGSYATLPRYGGAQPPHGQNPW